MLYNQLPGIAVQRSNSLTQLTLEPLMNRTDNGPCGYAFPS